MRRVILLSFILICTASTGSAQWVQQKTNVGVNLNGVSFISRSKGFAIGDNGTILETTDGGTTWTQMASPITSNLNKIWFADSTHGWITADNGTILSTTDGGTQWVTDFVSTPYAANYYPVFAATFNGNIEAWAAGGQAANGLTQIEKLTNGEWMPQISGFAGRVTGLYFVNDSVGWAVGDSSLMLSTHNGGRWWNMAPAPPIPPSPYFQGFVDVRFVNPQVGLCVGNAGVILKSTDGGASWKLIQATPNSNGILYRLDWVSDSVVFAAGDTADTNSPVILRSTDQGNTWETQQVPPLIGHGAHYDDIYFYNDSLGWAVGNWGTIVHTIDGGIGTLLNTPILLRPTAGDTLTASDTTLGWNSVPSASSYEVQIALDSSFSNVVLDSKSISDTSLGLKAFFNTVLNPNTKYFWRVKASSSNGISQFSNIWFFIVGTITSVNSPGLPKTYSLSQNYPNPFNPTTVINYSLPKRSFVTLTIYDDLGREVQTLVNNEQNAGNYSINFNASSLPSGAYFYRLSATGGSLSGQAGTYTQTKKLLLLK